MRRNCRNFVTAIREEPMTTQREKVRKLRALARSPNSHKAALAKARAEELERKIQGSGAKALAHEVARLLKAQGVAVRVRLRRGESERPGPRVDADVCYFYSRSRYALHRIEILITEYERRKGA
jgi:hypothetical protein